MGLSYDLAISAHPYAIAASSVANTHDGLSADRAIQDAGALAGGLGTCGLDDPSAGLTSHQDQRVAVATALRLPRGAAPRGRPPAPDLPRTSGE